MKIQYLIFTLCMAQVYCAVMNEYTTVTDEERAQGYSCKSSDDKLGLMKDGEVRKQYDRTSCTKADCGSGLITIYSCIAVLGPPECRLVSDLSKPYPDCCPKIVC
ncbi:hypothetical protein Trydic_g12614 [Trypoxylus dichotomus]